MTLRLLYNTNEVNVSQRKKTITRKTLSRPQHFLYNYDVAKHIYKKTRYRFLNRQKKSLEGTKCIKDIRHWHHTESKQSKALETHCLCFCLFSGLLFSLQAADTSPLRPSCSL